MTATKEHVNIAPLRRAVKELEAAEDRANPASECDTCRARRSMNVTLARENLIEVARKLV